MKFFYAALAALSLAGCGGTCAGIKSDSAKFAAALPLLNPLSAPAPAPVDPLNGLNVKRMYPAPPEK